MAIEGGLSTGKTILIGTIVLGCFAVLWPKIFVPMLFGPPTDLPSKTDHPVRGTPDGPSFVHPALRSENARTKPGPGGLLGGEDSPFYGEEGRHIRKAMEFKPGPVPGMRPSMGGHGMQPPAQQKGQGSMGVLMPIYTIGIVIFFLYTVMKIMFKKDNEQEEKFSNAHQQHHKNRAAPHQYGQQYRDIRMRHFQQQQQRMQQMQNANLHQQQYQKSAPLPVIPETQQQRNVLLQSENVSNYTPALIKEQSGLLNSSDERQNVDDQMKQTLEEVGNGHTAKVSNVMENLLNVAESVVNLREPSATPIARTDILCDKEDAMNDPRDDEIATLRKQLEETQRTMEQIIAKVSNVSNDVKEPIGTLYQEKSGQQSVTHSDHQLGENETTEDGNIKIESLQQDISGRSTTVDVEFRNNYTEIPSSDCLDDTVKGMHTTENDKLENVFEDTGNEQSESNSSNDSISSSNCTSGDDDGNIGVSELGAFQSAEIEAEKFDERYTEEECSDSDEEVHEYDTKYSNDGPIYQDESQYPFYYDKRHYNTSDHVDCDDESNEDDYQVDEGEGETRNSDDSLKDELKPTEENTSNCSQQSTQCLHVDENFKEAKDITLDSSNVSDQNDEDETTQSHGQVDNQEWDESPNTNTKSRESSLDHPLVSSTVQDDELKIDYNQENKQQLPENNHTQDTCHAQNDTENPNTCQRHRKDVELIFDDDQHLKHQLPSLLTSSSGRNRRRKRLRKT